MPEGAPSVVADAMQARGPQVDEDAAAARGIRRGWAARLLGSEWVLKNPLRPQLDPNIQYFY